MIIRKRINGIEERIKDKEGMEFRDIENIRDIEIYISWIRDKGYHRYIMESIEAGEYDGLIMEGKDMEYMEEEGGKALSLLF